MDSIHPAGDMAVIYLEADDLAAAFAAVGGSGEPFDRWFRDHVQEVHGISLAEGMPLPEQILGLDSDAAGHR